jgi:hypothetical protein
MYAVIMSCLNIPFSSYIVWTRKGYQHFQQPRGSSVIKVKGVGRVSIGNPQMYSSGIIVHLLRERESNEKYLLSTASGDLIPVLWDASEYGIPPLVCMSLHSIFN